MRRGGVGVCVQSVGLVKCFEEAADSLALGTWQGLTAINLRWCMALSTCQVPSAKSAGFSRGSKWMVLVSLIVHNL